jgi:hypothetical protein
MTSCRPLLTVLTMSLASSAACTPSSTAQRAPLAADSSLPTSNPTPTEPAPVAADEAPLPPPEPVPDVRPAMPEPAPQPIARPIAVPRVSGPYGVRIVDAASHNLPTYAQAGRTYVMGTVGSRYAIVLTNPTGRRVEAVVSVDGLDAMDGHPANYVEKRGYILPAYGDVSIDGFRTSYEQVATFRFSSVADSYAGRLGEARDVGVIGVAFFPEAPPVYVPPPPPPLAVTPPARSIPRPAARHYAPSPTPAAPPSNADLGGLASGSARAPARSSAAPSGGGGGMMDKDRSVEERRGLGTEFGEARDSRIGTTSFDRANHSVPSELVALRYNDRAGLLAVGIRIQPVYPSADLSLRESAEPFRTNGFAQPPP